MQDSEQKVIDELWGAKLIGLTGMPKKVAQTGKSTVSDYLVKNHGFIARGYADKLRSLALDINPYVKLTVQEHIKLFAKNYNPSYPNSTVVRLEELVRAVGYEEAKKNPDVRRFYQNLGTCIRTTLGQDIWVDSAFLEPLSPRTVFFDVRFDNEAETIIKRGGHIIAVDRKNAPTLEGNHPSEAGINPRYISGIIHNDGTLEELYQGVEQMLMFLGIK